MFESNGFISKLDYYIWESICQILRQWLDEGINPYPISINVSRVNLYNPKLCEVLINLVGKCDIPVPLLNLELTETACTHNPVAMKETVLQLQKHGFIIMMDDFISGYSSLNILKDIPVDALKNASVIVKIKKRRQRRLPA